MDGNDLISLYQQHPNVERIRAFLHEERSKTLHLNGLLGSSAAMVLAALEEGQKNTRVIMLNEREEAAYFFNDLTNLLGNPYR